MLIECLKCLQTRHYIPRNIVIRSPDLLYWVVILVTPVLRVIISLFFFFFVYLIVHNAKIKETPAVWGQRLNVCLEFFILGSLFLDIFSS